MFLNHFAFTMPSLGASFHQDELRSSDLMVLRARFRGGRVDESLHRPCGTRSADWNLARIVLTGPLSGVRSSAEARVGQMLLGPYVHGHPSRALTLESDWLDVLWRGHAAGARASTVAALSPRSIERARALARALEGDDVIAAVSALDVLLADLSSLGLRVAAGERAGANGTGLFAHALWDCVMDLARQPMAVDLAETLGVSERHALRQTSGFLRRFHLSASSWREFLQCLRVEMGTFFMSVPRARTEDVSRFLGFCSPTSFCHAFHDAGLPSPRAVQRELLCA
jgi:hypothetical protein